MASLPSKHPSLAIHMTDRATTPLISSAPSSSSQTQTQQQQQPPHPKQPKRNHHPTSFSTSPPSPSTPSTPTSSRPSSDEDDEDDEPESPPVSPATKQSRALTSLTATALLSYDAAKRLGRGAPLRTMVEHPDGGPVVLHSYMCPMGLALGVPGRNTSSTSLHTSAPLVGSAAGSVNGGDDDDGDGGEGTASAPHGRRLGNRRGPPSGPSPLSFGLDPVGGGGDGGIGGTDMEGIDPSDPPMLTSTVVAPRAEDMREARRATARLEKVARVFQAEWVSTGRR